MKVWIESDTLSKIRKKDKLGKPGKEGVCYLLPDNKVIKLFHGLEKKKKVYFDCLSNPQIAFPIDVLYDRESKLTAGYTMNYLQGESLLDGFKEDISIQEIKNAYLNMRLILLKYKDIYMDDLCLENLLYDYENKKINIIDTSRWFKENDAFVENIENFNWQMMTAILYSFRVNYTKLKQNKELNEILKQYENHIHDISMFLNFINVLERYVSEERQEKVKTIRDLKI
ncbi:MAG: hypothetical protein IKN63_00805 [Bacilli bacterium]|nr:hypothetical protein [Bacilli bacterium]